METKNQSKWYQSSLGIIGLLILFFPVGLFLMWKYAGWSKKVKWGITGFFGFMLLVSAISGQSSSPTKTANSSDTQAATQTQSTTPQPTAIPKPTDTPAPTPTPVPNDANGFPMDYETVTVAQIAKVPSSYQGKTVMFSCNVSSFVKDSSGDAGGFNCSDPNDYGSLLQVAAGKLFDYTKINQGDTVKIYGTGAGAGSGQNAFGGTVTEAIVDGLFINDLTTGYKN